MVFEAVCKTLLWWPSGAKVVHLRYKKIGKRLIINHLPIFKSDPLGINPKEADYYCYVLEARHLRAIYLLTFMPTSNYFIIV